MAPVDVTDDYYAVLEISQTASVSDVKKSYHRLAILRHPDKNQNKPDATASFQLLNRAYETLKDETSRRIYDIQWPRIRATYQTAQDRAKRDAEAANAQREKAAKEKAAFEAEEKKSKSTIESLSKTKQFYESEIFEVKRAINKLQSELKNIQTQEEKALAEERARNSWFTYAYSSVFRTPQEPEDAKQERDFQRLQRLASKTIKEEELRRKEKKLKEWNTWLSEVEKKIAAEVLSSRERVMKAEREREEARRREEAQAWKKRQEEFMEQVRANLAAAEALRRAAEERRKKEEEQRRKKEEEERRKREEERRKREEERRKREAKQAEEWRKLQEQWQKEEEGERKRIEEKEKEERRKKIEEILRQMKSRSTGYNGAKATAYSSASCQHKGWWEKVEHGSLKCENCQTLHRLFLFQCPDCRMRACAGCRGALKQGGNPRGPLPTRKSKPRARRRRTPQYEDSFDHEGFSYRASSDYEESFGYKESSDHGGRFDYDWYD